MPTTSADAIKRDRIRAGAAVLAIHAALGLLLVRGLDVDFTTRDEDALQIIDIPALAPPPPQPEPARLERRQEAAREEGQAAPPALEARAKPIAAPEPRVRLPRTPRFAAPKVAADGAKTTSGASPTPGLGTGAGGQGAGPGAGGSGTGPGGGGSGEGGGGADLSRPLRQVSGAITRRDYPRDAWLRPGLHRAVTVMFRVGPDGRASACRVTRPSGDQRVDAITCRLVEERYRFEPQLNRAGRPVSVEARWTQRLYRGEAPERDDLG